jgi:hypothetical protein
MTVTKQNAQYFRSIRHLHRLIAPIMLLPLLLTAITGTAYQIGDLAGKDHEFEWLLDWHKGHFGPLNLEVIYPFFNALGLCVLLFTGISMWLNLRRTSKKQST